jgi:calcineurin-like phosphoesterase family protein
MVMSETSYKVIRAFKDLKDEDIIYNVGDMYPKDGRKKPTKTRIKELSGDKNAHGAPIIEEVKAGE